MWTGFIRRYCTLFHTPMDYWKVVLPPYCDGGSSCSFFSIPRLYHFFHIDIILRKYLRGDSVSLYGSFSLRDVKLFSSSFLSFMNLSLPCASLDAFFPSLTRTLTQEEDGGDNSSIVGPTSPFFSLPFPTPSFCSSLALFRHTSPLLLPHSPRKPVRITAFNPWKKRPGGGLAGQLHGRPQMVHPHYFRHGYRRENPDDPTRLLSPNHVLLKRCPLCKRTKYIPLAEKDYYHTCCEGKVMRLWTTMRTVMNSEHKLIQAVRQWDVENERPWSNTHRPKPKGRSKLKKR